MSKRNLIEKIVEMNPTKSGKYFYYFEGDPTLPILVAHIDIVPALSPVDLIILEEGNKITSNTGLGADDRAGVYALLKLRESNPEVAILFCDLEEVGGIGASETIDTICSDIAKYKFIMEFDADKGGVVAFTNNEPRHFRESIMKYGWKEAHGYFTDVSILGPATKLNTCVVAVGFYRQHTKHEYLIVSDLEGTIDKANRLLLDLKLNR